MALRESDGDGVCAIDRRYELSFVGVGGLK